MKRLAILGATGSIGSSTLSLLEGREEQFAPVLLSAHKSIDALLRHGSRYPEAALSITGCSSSELGSMGSDISAPIHFGPDGLIDALDRAAPDLVLNAITGSAGLRASVWTLEHGLPLALANKESLVVAGPLLAALVEKYGGEILPVDSEHAAIHQCLRGERRQDLRRIYLTCSGGPFRDHAKEAIATATREEALAHPNWAMGDRITIGSATLMNKAFEVIEARHLFDLEASEIDVWIHRQSIIHSMVAFCDASIMAQLGVPDMRVPILYCLGHPHRLPFEFEGFDPDRFAQLSFEPVDHDRFPALRLGFQCLERGGDSGAVLNAADEVATQAFLAGRIPFPKITEIVERVLEGHETAAVESVAQILEVDQRAREEAAHCLD